MDKSLDEAVNYFEEDPSFLGMRKELLIHSILWKFATMQILSSAAEAFTILCLGKSINASQILVPFVAPANIV